MAKKRVRQINGVRPYYVPEEAAGFEAKCAVLRANEQTAHRVELE